MNGKRYLSFIRYCLTIVIIVSIIVGFSSVQVQAATGVNQVINFQGKVINSSGTNVTDGTYDFVFKLYDGASSGSSTLFTESWTSAALWSSTMSSAPGSGGESLTYATDTNESTIKVGQILWNTTKGEAVIVTSVNTGTNVIGISPTTQAWAGSDTVTNKVYVKDGIFRVSLNALNQDLSGVDFNTDNIFLGVNFNGDGEMKPRIQYTAVPYALNAKKVAGLTVTDTTGTLTIPNGKTISFADAFTTSGGNALTLTTTSTTNVTLPTTGTLSTLAGNETLTNKLIGSTGLTFSGAAIDITTGTNEDLSIMPNGTGKLGVGSTAPTSLLHLTGAVKGKALTIFDETGDQALFTASAAGVPKFIIDHAGSVGIGTTTTTGNLNIMTGAVTSSIYFSDGRAYAAYDASAGYAKFGSSQGKDVSLIAGGTDYLRLQNATGYIGIGTTNPTERLEVTGNASVSGNLTLAGAARTIASRAFTPLTFGDSQTGDLILQPKGTSTTGIVQVGAGAAGSTTPDLFALDVKSDTGDPTAGFEGAMYYNTFDNKFRCYQGSAWADCIGTGGAGPWTDGTGITYLTDTAEDFAVGGSSLASPFSVDVSANTARIGTGSTANAVLSMYASNGSTGTVTYTTNDGWAFEGGFLGVGTTNATQAIDIGGASANMTFSSSTGPHQIITAGSTDLALMPGRYVGIGTTAPSYKLDVVSSDTTGVLQLTGNSVTTGNAFNLVANELSSGNAFAISSTSTALTSGGLINLDWSPGSAVTATGDILGINIGANGTIGTLLNLKNNGSSIFSVSQTQITNALPTSFTAPGDVSISYDLAFTNQTASYIKSNAPLYVETGESFESNDLTLRTFNAGNVIVDLTGSGGLAIGNGVTPVGKIHIEGAMTGKALAIFNETGDQALLTASASGTTKFIVDHSGNVGIGTTSPLEKLDIQGNATAAGNLTFGGAIRTIAGRAFNSLIIGDSQTGELTLQPKGSAITSVVRIGAGGAGSTTPDYLGLDVKSDTGDPSGGFEGAMYYNTFDNKFRCYQGAAWTDCIGSGGSVLWSGVGDPTGNLSLTMGANTSLFTYNAATGANDLFKLTDTTNNSGTGYLFNLTTASGSTLKPIHIVAAGVEAFSIDASGRVGIGTTSPTSKIHVTGKITGKALAIFDETGDQALFTASAAGVTKFVIDHSGNVGVGTTNPTAVVDVKSSGTNTDVFKLIASDGSRLGRFTETAGGTGWFEVDDSSGIASVLFRTDAGASYISSGNFGVGTTSPNNKLEVTSTTTPQVRFAYDTSNYVTFAVSSAGAVTVDATGASAGLTFSDAVTASSTLAATSTVTIGSAGNTFTFNPASGPVYAGTARPTRQMRIPVEYPGATLTASGSATITGSMTADSVRDATAGWMNYYEWTSTQASLQNYTIAVKIQLPSNFSAWATSNALQINYATEVTDNAKNKLDVSIYNMTTNPDKVVYQSLTNASGSSGAWSTVTVDDSQLVDSTAPDLDTADQTAIIFLKPYSLVDAVNCTAGVDNGCYVRLGDIVLNYVAKY